MESKMTISRAVVYAALVLFALYFLYLYPRSDYRL